MVSKIKKISLFIIVCLVILISIYIIDFKFHIIGKSKEILISEKPIIIETLDFPRCKFEMSNNFINSENNFVDIKIRYNQEMNIRINPEIKLTNSEVKYYFEESQWFDNKTFLTKIIIEDLDQETETAFIVSNAMNVKGSFQQPLNSESQDVYLTIDTKEPKLSEIIIDSRMEDSSSIVYLYFDQEFEMLQKELENYFIGVEKNTAYELNKKDNVLLLSITPKITTQNLKNYFLYIKKDVITDKSKNTNNHLELEFRENNNIPIKLLEIEEIDPPIISDDFTITEFEIEPGSSRGIVYFSEGVYSAKNTNLSKNNFTVNKNSIKTISHVAGDNKATILFNEIVTEYEDLLIEVNEIYNVTGKVIIEENSNKLAQNKRISLPLIKGWNLISFPNNLNSNYNLNNNLNIIDSLDIYEYIDSQWIPLNSHSQINQGAYFINSPIAQELFIELDRSQKEIDISNLQPGWNLIGFPINLNDYQTFILSDVLTNTDSLGIIILIGTNYNTTPFTYTFGEENSPILSPFEGYWLYLENNPGE